MDNAKRTDEEKKAVRQRLAEIKEEMTRLKAERQTLRKRRGAKAAGAKNKPKTV